MSAPTDPGSSSANQSKAEPMPPTAAHADPDEAPGRTATGGEQAAGMTAGAAAEHQASHPAAGGRAERVPGDLGRPAEEIETDVAAGARRMSAPAPGGTPGDAAGVPVASGQPLAGSSEGHAPVQGVRTEEGPSGG